MVCVFAKFPQRHLFSRLKKKYQISLLFSVCLFSVSFNKNRNPPWWDQELNSLRKEKNKALNKYLKTKSKEDMIASKKLYSNYKRMVITKKEKSWEEYVNQMDEELDSGDLY